MPAFRDVVFNTKLGGVGQAASDAQRLSRGLAASGRGMRRLGSRAGQLASRMKGVVGGFLSIKGILLGAGFARVAGFFGSMVTALEEQEAAQVRLATAMRASKTFTIAGMESLREYARQLQQVTAFGDEVTLSAMGMLATFKMAPDDIKLATKAMLDMAAATGAQLDQVAILLGKAFAGQIGSLSRYGVVVDKADFKTRGFIAVIDELKKEFGGMAEAMAKTPVGQLRQLKNIWGDMKEEMGKAVVESGAFKGLMDALRDGMEDIRSFLEANPDFLGNVFATGVAAIRGFIAIMPGFLGLMSTAIEHARTLLTVWLALKGAIAGAQLGAAFPAGGALIGGIIGGLAGLAGGQFLGSRLNQAREEALERQRFVPTFERTGGTQVTIENQISAPITVEGAGDLSRQVETLHNVITEEMVEPLDELGGDFYRVAQDIKNRERYERTV